MTCKISPGIIVCGNFDGRVARRVIGDCPTCKQRRRLVFRYDNPYYGADWDCTACGERWSGDGLYGHSVNDERREQAAAKAKSAWANAPAGPYREDSDYYPLPDSAPPQAGESLRKPYTIRWNS